jgi:hypothetical protein
MYFFDAKGILKNVFAKCFRDREQKRNVQLVE